MIVNKRSIYLFRILTDLLLLNLAFIAAAAFAQTWEILLERNYMFFLLIGLNVLWIISSNTTAFYDDFYSRNFSVQFINILKSTALQSIVTIVFIFLAKEDLFTRYFIVYFSILLILLVSLRVILFRKVLKYLRRRGKNIRSLLVVGNGEVAHNFKTMVESNPDFGYHFLGFLSDNDKEIENQDTIGKSSDLENIIASKGVEEVVVATSGSKTELLQNIVSICNRKAIKIHIIPDYFNYVSSRFQISTFGDFPIVTVRREPLDEIQWRIIKRSFDIIFSFGVVVFILSWLFPIIFIISKLTSRGSVMFIQDRVGTKNEMFHCYKFRTMKDISEVSNNTFKPVVQNDPRITKLGKFLRRSNLDELPQFVNVLFGDMSVVGPRPHAIPYDLKYGKVVDEIRLRHNVNPGITGWAQIHGLRGDVTDEEENKRRTIQRIEYDLWYIENWTFTLDFQIILLTIWQMIRGKTRAV
jgi:putative colanic acid biosynthesis UDP-glucose lipid carrier transferase